MNHFGESPGFFDFLSELPWFFLLFGGLLTTLVVGSFAYIIIRGLTSWSSNNAAALLHQRCKVVDKRTEVWGGSGDSSANTNYFITFEFEDHSRKELQVRGNNYGLMTVGDQGELAYQGTRFKEFIRQT